MFYSGGDTEGLIRKFIIDGLSTVAYKEVKAWMDGWMDE
jgi:hypothetical protein